MAVSKSNIQRKYDQIRKRYMEMKAVRVNGVQKYTSAYIISILANEFYLEAATIENIIWTKS